MRSAMNRLVLLLMLILSLSSCATYVGVEQITVTEITDYAPLTDKGIFVTEANNVNYDYVPLGSVVSTTRGAILPTMVRVDVDMNKLFDSIGNELIQKGANGLINLKISNTYEPSVVYTTVTGMAVYIKDLDLKMKEAKEVPSAKLSDCVVDGIKALIIQRRPSGIFVSTSEKMTPVQIMKMVDELQITGKAVQIFLSDGGNKAYAGITDNGYYINYETKEFIELSKINLAN